MGTKGPLAHDKWSHLTKSKIETHKSKLNTDKLNLCYFNCQGLANEERLVELDYALARDKINILGIAETKSQTTHKIPIFLTAE